MRAILDFYSDSKLRLPVQYNHLVQGFIYSSISPRLAGLLHSRGFQADNRRFRLFTFSRIGGKFRIDKDDDTITFDPPFRIVISSALGQFIEEIGNEMLRNEELRIGGNTVRVGSIKISKPELSERNRIRMLSPMTIYSTLKKADGKKKTYYYTPYEKEFSDLISENVWKKFKPGNG